jgi:hypothetical protein
MKSHLLDIAPYLAYPLALLQILKAVRLFWSRIRKETAPVTPKSRRESARFFAVLVGIFPIGFGLVLLLAISLQKTSTLSPTLVLLAGAVAALGLLGHLVVAFGLPAYNYTKDLEQRCQDLEERDQIREMRVKALELEVQSVKQFLEEQFPSQQKLAFMNGVVNAETRDEYTS